MNDCLWCMIYGDKEHPGDCLSINSQKGRELYSLYSADIERAITPVKLRWNKSLAEGKYNNESN